MNVSPNKSRRDVEPILLFRIDRQPETLRPRRARKRQQPRPEFGAADAFPCPARNEDAAPKTSPKSTAARKSHRHACVVNGPAACADGVDSRHIALEIPLGILLGTRRFAKHVVGKPIAFLFKGPRP